MATEEVLQSSKKFLKENELNKPKTREKGSSTFGIKRLEDIIYIYTIYIYVLILLHYLILQLLTSSFFVKKVIMCRY